MSRSDTSSTDSQGSFAGARYDLTTLSTSETLVAATVICAAIWALIGVTILGT